MDWEDGSGKVLNYIWSVDTVNYTSDRGWWKTLAIADIRDGSKINFVAQVLADIIRKLHFGKRAPVTLFNRH